MKSRPRNTIPNKTDVNNRIAPRYSSPPLYLGRRLLLHELFGTASAGISKFRGAPVQEALCRARVDYERRRALVAIHGHPLRAAAHLALGRRADGPAALGAALLERQQLLGAERLVVDLRRRLDEVLEVRAEEEVAEVDEFAVVLILDVDNTPPVLAPADLLAIDNDGLLGADDSEGDQTLLRVSVSIETTTHTRCTAQMSTHLNLAVDGALLVVKLVVVVRVHLEVVEGKLLLDALLERLALLQGEGVGLGNDGHDVDHVGQLLQHDNIDGLERVARGLNEEQAAVDARVLDVALALGGELLAQVRRVLVLDVLDDGVPAAVVVDQVAVAGGVDDVEPQADAVLLDNVRDGLDIGGRAHDLIGVEAALGLDEVRGEDGVDQCRLAETGLACNAKHVNQAELGRELEEEERREERGRGGRTDQRR